MKTGGSRCAPVLYCFRAFRQIAGSAGSREIDEGIGTAAAKRKDMIGFFRRVRSRELKREYVKVEITQFQPGHQATFNRSLSPAHARAGRTDIGHDNPSEACCIEARSNKIRLELGIGWYAIRSNCFPEWIALHPSGT